MTYGEAATLDRRNVLRWWKMVSEGGEGVNEEYRVGRLTAAFLARVLDSSSIFTHSKKKKTDQRVWIKLNVENKIKCNVDCDIRWSHLGSKKRFSVVQKRLHKCMMSGGDYFEVDKIHIHM